MISEARRSILRRNFHASLDTHGISGKGIIGLGLPVIMISSENPFIAPGARGVLVILEQGTDLSVIVAVFHHLQAENTLGPPVECRRPIFTYVGAI